MEGVNERLGEIATQLMFVHVPLLGMDLGGADALGSALEPTCCLEALALLIEGQGGHEPAQHEAALRLCEGEVVVAEAIGVSVLTQLLDESSDRRGTPRIVCRHRTPDSREQ